MTGRKGHKWHRTKTRCCRGVTYMTAVLAEERGARLANGHRGLVRSQKVLHVDGEERFWHWRDQVDRLAEG